MCATWNLFAGTMAENKRFDTKSTGCLEGLFNLLALNQRLQMPKTIAYRKHGEGSNNTIRVEVPKPKTSSEKDENISKETSSDSQTGKSHMFIWRALMFKKKTPGKDKKKSSSPASSPSSSRLLRSRSIHHSKCFDYEVPDELAAHYHAMDNSSSSEMGSSHSEPPPLPHESPKHPNVQEPDRACGSMDGKDIIDLEAPNETTPANLTAESEAPSTQKTREAATHHSKEFLDFLELFNAHRELFLKILHDPSLLVPTEQQGQEASSSGSVPLKKLESFPRPGGSSGKRNPIFDRSDSEKRRSEIQRSPSRTAADLEAAKVISTRMPTGVDSSAVSLAESRSLKKAGTASNHFKAISRKIKDVVRENRKELARITKDGVFHKLPYGQKMSGLTRSSSMEKFVQEEKQIRRSYSIAESVDKYSTLYESTSRDSRIPPERLNITTEGGASLNDKKMPKSLKRITSLPEMRLCSSHQEALPDVSASQIGSKTCNVESDHFSSRGTNAFSICAEGNFYPDDVTENSENIHIQLNYGGLEENFRGILRSPSLSSLGRSFSHRRINSLPSFDRAFFQDRTRSFTECSIADSEPPFENLQLEDEDWLVKPPLSAAAYAANFNDEEWLVTPLKHSGIMNGIDREDEEWLVKATQLSGAKDVNLEDEEWLVKSGQPNDALDSDFRFIHEFAEQGAAEPLHIYVSDKNEADFQYVKDILKKSGFSCGDVDWYASNQPVNPVVFDEAEGSCQELSMASDEPHCIIRRMLLFDLINEVLLDIYDSSLVIGPWHSRFDLRTRPIPMGYHVLEEVWAKVSCYLSLHWEEGQTVEDIVAHDLMRKDGWMNLVYDAECTALDMEDLMVEDLLDDVVIQIVLESIDE